MNTHDEQVLVLKIARLEAALREALDKWDYAINRAVSGNSSIIQADRITELRKQFLED